MSTLAHSSQALELADGGGGDSCSDRSACSHQPSPGRFLTRGAFLLTPSHELTLDRAANILDKMSFRGDFSVTKTATGILFRFSEPEDFQAVFRRGFHRATGGRLYRKVVVPCRPHRTFSLVALDVPADLPEEDVRASLYRYGSVVEVTRLRELAAARSSGPSTGEQQLPPACPPPVRITLASLDEYNSLLQHGLDFYGATYFPTEPLQQGGPAGNKEPGATVVFDASGFTRIPAPATRTLRAPRQQH